MSLIRWDPYRRMVSLQQAMNRLFDEGIGRYSGETSWEAGSDLPVPVDVYETENELVVRASLPGIKPEDVEISVTDNTLVIRGEYGDEQESESETFYLRERRHGTFQRSIALPLNLDTDKVEAIAKDGVLKLEIPKTEETKPKRISVKAE